MSRGRKPKAGVRRRYRVTFSLWEGYDDDLIVFLEGLPERKRAVGIQTALRSGGAMTDAAEVQEDDDDDMDFDLGDFLS